MRALNRCGFGRHLDSYFAPCWHFELLVS